MARSKRCRRCHRTKRIGLFYKQSRSRDGYATQCKSCQNKVSGDKKHDRHVRQRYGITHDEYSDMLVSQGGRCAICHGGTSKRYLAVDHDHRTGEVRGLLCATCNRVLGRFRDDPARFRQAARYLVDPPSRTVLTKRDWGQNIEDDRTEHSG